VCLQDENYIKASYYFEQVNPNDLEQRSYLYYGAKADYYSAINNKKEALRNINIAIETVHNNLEKEFLIKKRGKLSN